MHLSRKEYYAMEALAFLSAFPMRPWSSIDIAAVIVLNTATKTLLKDISPNTDINELEEKMKPARDFIRNTKEDLRRIQDILSHLSQAGLIEKVGRKGFRITDAGKKTNLLLVMTAIGYPLRGAECIETLDGQVTFDCPKRNAGACGSYKIWCHLSNELENLFSKVTVESMISDC